MGSGKRTFPAAVWEAALRYGRVRLKLPLRAREVAVLEEQALAGPAARTTLDEGEASHGNGGAWVATLDLAALPTGQWFSVEARAYSRTIESTHDLVTL